MLCSRFKRYTNHMVTGQCCSDSNSSENRTAKTSKGRFEGPFCSSQTTEGAVQKKLLKKRVCSSTFSIFIRNMPPSCILMLLGANLSMITMIRMKHCDCEFQTRNITTNLGPRPQPKTIPNFPLLI